MCVAAQKYVNTVTYAPKYTSSRRKVAYLKELYRRKLEVGPDEVKHPSAFGCWNHASEVYAFGKRLGEEFDEQKLAQAFIQKSFVESEKEKQKNLGLLLDVNVEDNTKLAHEGRILASDFVKAYLRYSYPHLFEEGICAIHDFLMSHSTLFHVASNLGVRDLIQSPTYPPSEEDYITTLMAVIGALTHSDLSAANNDHDVTNTKKGLSRAELFVLDFLVPQLIGRDVMEMWELANPMGLLVGLLRARGLGQPEPRMLWDAAKNTIMPVYNVGIYVDKKLIGKSPGETAAIAEEMAARDTLRNLLGMSNSRSPLQLGDQARHLQLDYRLRNASVQEVTSV
ncbi:hypothetical protein DPMN_014947 [Dreissena polymorpha]|uniref:Large ribosomal subunit protein mL44 n=1 Tax=Dreissena polymorpha TaxID=45954 RepID=A0A9D4NAC2_DREPO|nr:hypothetical protein DPMN_014947 [Dreissena polymorpha]